MRRARRLALHAIERREEAQVLFGGYVLVQRVVLGHESDARPRRAERSDLAQHAHGARGGHVHTHDEVHERRLAAA